MADILVVDDEIGIRELLAEILGDEGHVVVLAENAQEAREARENQDIDLVLLDIWMPDTDGLALLREWSASGRLTIPVVMMSGHAMVDAAVEATRIGAMDFLEKPITLKKLLKSVENALTNFRAPKKLVQSVIENSAARSHDRLRGSVSAYVSTQEVDSLSIVSKESARIGSSTSSGFVSVPSQELSLDVPLREARDAFERLYFEHHLSREHGSMTRVAEKTGLERTHLYRKLKQLGIDLLRSAYRGRQNS